MSKKKILLTGGGTGGHIYPLLATALKLKEIGGRQVEVEYIGPTSGLTYEFEAHEIRTHSITGAKIRRYMSVENLLDIPKFFFSLLEAWIKMFFMMPDIVLSKGGSGSVPVVLAARFYRVPVIVHESDIVPSLTTRISAKFAKSIGVSFKDSVQFFPKDKTFWSGNPVREHLVQGVPPQKHSKTYFDFDPDQPLILVMGGSQGSTRLNDLFILNGKEFVQEFQIHHLVGEDHIEGARKQLKFLLRGMDQNVKNRYQVSGYLGAKEMKFAYSAADLIISRAGAGAIFEMAAFGKPSILVPLEESANNHQKENAYAYSEAGACVVVEEANFELHIVLDRIRAILSNEAQLQSMSQSASDFSMPSAAEAVAREVLVSTFGNDAVIMQ